MTPKHLPVLALVLMIATELKGWAWLLIVLLLNLVQDGAANWWFAAGFIGFIALVVGLAGLRYWRFTYALEAHAITINAGLFVKKSTHIPYANIQTLQRQQWFFLRPFGLESVTIETSSQESKGGEGRLFAVPLEVATAIEAKRHHRPEAAQTPTASDLPATAPELVEAEMPEASAQPADQPLTYRINARDLNRYALTSLGFLPILAAVVAIWNKLDDLIPDRLEEQALDQLAHLAALVIVFLVIVALLLAIFVSYLNLLQRYYNFTLTREANTLSATRGFFKRNIVSVRLPRIQAVRFQSSILRQLLRLTTVQALTASNAAEDDADRDLVLMPVVSTAKAYPTMHPFINWLPGSLPALTKVPATSHFYFIRNIVLGNLVVIAAFLGVTFAVTRPWLPWALVIAGLWLVAVFLQGRYAACNAGVAIIDDNRLVIQSGNLWTRSQYIVRRANIQSLTIASSYWLAKRAKAHLRVNIRRGNGNKQLEVRYLDRATATAIADWYQPSDKNLQLLAK